MIEPAAIKAVFEKALKLEDNQSCLIITDKNKRSIANVFYDYAFQKTGEKARLIEIPAGTRPGGNPPSEVIVQMLLYDVEFLITTYSLSHTTARRNASKNGIRIASMPDITEDIINRCFDIDYDALKSRCGKLHQIIAAASEIKIRTEKGTDLTIKRGSNEVFGLNGADLSTHGAFGNLPDGEISFAPADASGVCFIDASVSGIGKLDEPIKVVFENSKAVAIEGAKGPQLKEILDIVGPGAYMIAELGVGANDKAIISGRTLEDEKSLGTAHIAFGNNLSFGGKNDVPLHIDGVMRDAEVYVDNARLDIRSL
jgi:leucyl aminopeptidase (aminopeptidase T)